MTDRQKPLTQQPDVIRDALRVLGPTGTLAEAIVQQAALAYVAILDAERAARQEAADTSGLRGAIVSALDWLDHGDEHAAAHALRAALSQERTPDERPLDGWAWECADCDRPVPPMGMCETCGVFGVLRLSAAGE